MKRLVVLEAHGTADFVEQLQRAWDDGDAVFPLDPRLPAPAREALLAAARPDEPVEDGDALVVATSGSTGAPKCVVLTHDAVAASAEASSKRLGIDPGTDRWLACLPLAHVGGLGVVTRALHTGTPLTVVERPDPDVVAAGVAEGCTRVSLVPTLLQRIDTTPFRTVLLGGSTMPPTWPANTVPTYGMTETGSGVVYAGRPLDDVELRIADAEIHVRGPMLLRCYRDGTDPKDADGWFATGDGGEFGPDELPALRRSGGRLLVRGRIGDLIVTGGEKVWPSSVERVLATHPGVGEVVVFGRPDPAWGHRVVARIVPADPAQPPTLDALRAHVKSTLPRWAAPHELELATTLPRTPSGKLRRPSR